MKTNTLLSLGLAAALGFAAVLPAAAGTTAATTTTAATAASTSAAKPTHFYIALKAKGPGCEVVEAKPTAKMMVGHHSYKTEADASKALASAKACKA